MRKGENMKPLHFGMCKVNKKWISDADMQFSIIAKINNQAMEFRFSEESHTCNEIFLPRDDQEVEDVKENIVSGRQSHFTGESVKVSINPGFYAIRIPESILKSKPKKDQRNYSFTGREYSTSLIPIYFKEIIQKIYESGSFNQEFLDIIDPPSNI